MNVSGYATDAEADWTTPYPTAKCGVKLRLLRGDVMYPVLDDVVMRPGREGEAPNWFNCIPKIVVRETVGYRPFFSLGIGWWGVYAGWKTFGVDSEAYVDYPRVLPRDVYPGSRAMCFTVRFTTQRGYA
jgi:hypothetical protein